MSKLHRPRATPHASLYFPYRVHAAAAAVPARDAQVVVVGAGPIGLVTALGLAQQGVRCVVLAAELQVCEGSRAIVFGEDKIMRSRHTTFFVEQFPLIYLPWMSVADRQTPFFFIPGKKKPW